jgi:hypothetical protein
MEFVSHLTNESVKSWDALAPAYRRMLEGGGIDAAGWESIRRTPLELDGGTPWLKPVNVEDRDLGDKLMEIIHSEMLYAVPEMDLRTRAFVNSRVAKGTWMGELMRSGLLFKGFGITMIGMQSRRIMEIANRSLWSAAGYAAGLTILTTLGGAMALEMKALLGGKDVRPVGGNPLPTGEQLDDLAGSGNYQDLKSTYGQQYWGAAMLQGGGFGIFGDLLQSQENRFGGVETSGVDRCARNAPMVAGRLLMVRAPRLRPRRDRPGAGSDRSQLPPVVGPHGQACGRSAHPDVVAAGRDTARPRP